MFTSRVELLKLAVILALWAAVVAAFVSVIYRRQSDVDAAKARDLKLVYDLQLDREISARREYELTVESELRRELSTEMRAQAADEMADLRAELAALRANLEYLFDADLSHRPAIETERRAARPGRIASSRIDTDEGPNLRTEEHPIIDVAAEPHAPEHEWSPIALFGGVHRRASEAEPTGEERLAWAAEQRAAEQRAAELRAAEQRAAEARAAQEEAARRAVATQWRPAPATGEWIPAGTPGSNWSPSSGETPGGNGSAGEYLGRRRAAEPAMWTPPAGPRRGRHSAPPDASDPGRPIPPPSPTPAAPPPQPASPSPAARDDDNAPRHRSPDEAASTGGHSVAELLARLEVGSPGGGRRRRRED